MPISVSKLGLSAAQFGLDGMTSAPRGRSPEAEARDILNIAARSSLSVLDASGVYGRAESVLGDLIPRPVSFRVTLSSARADRGADFVESEARASLRRLGLERADAIIVQSPSELFGPHGAALWDRLARLRDEGLFAKIGVSAHASDDPVGVARRFKPDILQAPASLLDQRLLADGSLARIAGLGVEVQLRSIFLNGLLFLPPDRVPAQLKGASGRLSRVRRMIAEGRSDPLQAALGFALSRPEASAVLVGVASAAELSAVVAAASSPPPDLDWDEMAIDDPVALDPRRWVA
ncbi:MULTISPECIES: bifunctional regulator KidO [unclassified Caulobacter]|uniref:bifunctional regulator KidO n=1 Tax=unclassified Caulobacter TaxID=2648921 RepID=UPI000D3342FB|nr:MULTISPECIES: bifunctional regulator KidO [unclassified Caulobacter]PTS89134.1 bifunctional regulator KidO [Caulobacter sp. HMWF009]PTT06706.1 bifunctional regulator KidO [Caulobacter sp. HMWF025]